MSFAWPWMLLSLVAVPLLAVLYRRALRRRAARRAELATLGLVATSTEPRGLRRHVTPLLFLGALTLLLVSAARPQATIAEPHREGTVVLAFDVSNSMAADDLTPTRMAAAKAAARTFVAKQPPSIRIGIVAFGDGGVITEQPTKERADVLAAIERLRPVGGTALAQGIYTSLTAIAGKAIPVDPNAPEELRSDMESVDIGYYGSSVVVLLSDGENTGDSDPMLMAELASVAGVRVHTIGIGTPEGAVLEIDGFQVATALDQELLTEISSTTDGTYYAAEDKASLASVYDSIDLEFSTTPKELEVTSLFAGAGALLLLAGAVLALVWFGRVL